MWSRSRAQHHTSIAIEQHEHGQPSGLVSTIRFCRNTGRRSLLQEPEPRRQRTPRLHVEPLANGESDSVRSKISVRCFWSSVSCLMSNPTCPHRGHSDVAAGIPASRRSLSVRLVRSDHSREVTVAVSWAGADGPHRPAAGHVAARAVTLSSAGRSPATRTNSPVRRSSAGFRTNRSFPDSPVATSTERP